MEQINRQIGTFIDKYTAFNHLVQFIEVYLHEGRPLAAIGWYRDRIMLRYSQDAKALSIKHFGGLTKHEFGHVLLGHFFPRRNTMMDLILTGRGVKDSESLSKIKNVVMDMEINGTWVPIDECPPGGIDAKQYDLNYGLLAEEYARLLPITHNPDGTSHVPGTDFIKDLFGELVDELGEDQIREWTKEIKARGQLTGDAERLIDKIYEPPDIEWVKNLHKSMIDMIRSSQFLTTYGRENRRYADCPGKMYKKPPRCWIFYDTSGSMGPDELALCSGAIQRMRRYFSKMWVVVNDAAVKDVFEFRPGMVINKVKGGGGSDFNPAFDYIKDKARPKDVVIMLTDGDIGVPPTKPTYRILWVLTREKHVPYGDSIIIRKEASK